MTVMADIAPVVVCARIFPKSQAVQAAEEVLPSAEKKLAEQAVQVENVPMTPSVAIYVPGAHTWRG